jgi:hypothetical protein
MAKLMGANRDLVEMRKRIEFLKRQILLRR